MSRPFRLISDLSEHEKNELEIDFNISVKNKYAIVAVTEIQWIILMKSEKK